MKDKKVILVNIADLTNPETGKTYREENNAKQHKFKVGDLVEVEYSEIRLYVIGCVRDCDGSPLYRLGDEGMELHKRGSERFYNPASYGSYGEGSLKLIKEAK